MRFLKSPMGFISATMFLNFAGLTIIIPVIPYIVERYTDHVALYIGLITSIASLCQFLAAPALGYVSDIVGRRPVLLLSLLGGVAGYVVFGIGGALWVLFLGRIIDGLTSGDTTAMYAYVADVYDSRERARQYGILGAVAAFGFMTGPVVGGLAAQISLTAPLFVAAGLSFLNVCWGYFALPESLKRADRAASFNIRHLNPFTQFKSALATPALRVLFASMFVFFVGIILEQSNISVFLKDVLQWGPLNIGILLTLVGLADMLTEGYLIRKLLPLIGEVPLAGASTIVTALGMLMIVGVAVTASAPLLFGAAIVFSIGDGLFEPAITGLIANATPPHMHGRIQGASQGTQSIARFVAPLMAGVLYEWTPSAPYVAAAALMMLSLAILFLFRPRIRSA
jgi:DHA1 family tetracycline resistance protein-like MFS transporter